MTVAEVCQELLGEREGVRLETRCEDGRMIASATPWAVVAVKAGSIEDARILARQLGEAISNGAALWFGWFIVREDMSLGRGIVFCNRCGYEFPKSEGFELCRECWDQIDVYRPQENGNPSN